MYYAVSIYYIHDIFNSNNFKHKKNKMQLIHLIFFDMHTLSVIIKKLL